MLNIESDPEVRRVSQEAIASDHEIAQLVRNLKPGDPFDWPGNGGKATAVSAKHNTLMRFMWRLAGSTSDFPQRKASSRSMRRAGACILAVWDSPGNATEDNVVFGEVWET